jgi:hypothetical protein
MPDVLDAATVRAAVNALYRQGWVPIPLGLDDAGRPKRPLDAAWQELSHDARRLRALRWGDARGVGLVLGPASGNLAVIDVDDADLAADVFALLVRGHVETRLVWTIRRRLHVYVREETPSASTRLAVRYRDRVATVELRARGTQVAAPPTPGYVLANPGVPPLPVPSIGDAWASIARRLGLADVARAGDGAPRAGYPRPWQERVPAGERNMAAYVEAHRLREAGVPLEVAREIMRARYASGYEPGGITLASVLRTVESAYRKAGGPARAGRPRAHWGGVPAP